MWKRVQCKLSPTSSSVDIAACFKVRMRERGGKSRGVKIEKEREEGSVYVTDHLGLMFIEAGLSSSYRD